MIPRRSLAALALCSALAPACDDDGVTEPRVQPRAPDGPELAAVAVTVTVFGTESDPDGFELVLGKGGLPELVSTRVEPEGGTAAFENLPPDSYEVGLGSVDDPCVVEGEALRSLAVERGERGRIGYVVACLGPDVSAMFDRTDAGHDAERFLLRDDDTFVWDGGPAEFPGTYSLADGVYRFDFDWTTVVGETTATGDLEGECLAVSYSPAMQFGGWEDGTYCPLPLTTGARR